MVANDWPVEQRLDFWCSQIVAAGVNPWRRKGRPAVNPKDLIPNWWEAAYPERTVEDWKSLFKGITLAMGGKIEGDEGDAKGQEANGRVDR